MVKCTVCGRSFKTAGALQQHRRDTGHMSVKVKVTPPPPRATRAPRKARLSIASNVFQRDLAIPIRREDLFASIRPTKTGGKVNPEGYSFFPFSFDLLGPCKNISKNFEIFKINSMRLVYKTCASTNRDGQIVMGIDYNSKTSFTATKTSILSMQSMAFSLHANSRPLVLKLDKNERFVAGTTERDIPFTLYCWYSGNGDDVLYGDIFIQYDIVLSGPLTK